MITYRQASGLTELSQAYFLARDLDAYYPEFGFWFANACVPAVMSGRDKMVVAELDGQMIGMALAKASAGESKLRCVRVAPEHKNRGVAVHLIDRTLRLMDCSLPATSVAEELFHDWSRILINRFGFQLDRVEKGMFRKGKLEYFFNGAPAPKAEVGSSQPLEAPESELILARWDGVSLP